MHSLLSWPIVSPDRNRGQVSVLQVTPDPGGQVGRENPRIPSGEGSLGVRRRKSEVPVRGGILPGGAGGEYGETRPLDGPPCLAGRLPRLGRPVSFHRVLIQRNQVVSGGGGPEGDVLRTQGEELSSVLVEV